MAIELNRAPQRDAQKKLRHESETQSTRLWLHQRWGQILIADFIANFAVGHTVLEIELQRYAIVSYSEAPYISSTAMYDLMSNRYSNEDRQAAT